MVCMTLLLYTAMFQPSSLGIFPRRSICVGKQLQLHAIDFLSCTEYSVDITIVNGYSSSTCIHRGTLHTQCMKAATWPVTLILWL